jgi:DNA-binding FadR family transcriptional regulator
MPTRAEQLVDRVEQRIIDEGLAPGAKISTREELRVDSGFARATVNEAVRILRDRGVVNVRPGPGGGIFVALGSHFMRVDRSFIDGTPSVESVADAAAVRQELEGLIAADAARSCSLADSKDLAALLDAIERASGDLPSFIGEVWDLHRRIALIGKNAILKATYLGLVDYVQSHRSSPSQLDDSEPPEYFAFRLELHRELVGAVLSGDPERARLVADRHSHELPLRLADA